MGFRICPSLRRWDFASERVVFDVLKETLSEGSLFVDVGANFGMHSLVASRLVGPNGKVVAFEPVVRNLNLISRNLEFNRFHGRVEIVAGAVSDLDTATVCFSVDESECAVGSAITDKSAGISVANHRLDDVELCYSRRFDLLKIDVEGAELKVLRSAEHILSQYSPVVAVEVHPGMMASFDTSVDSLVSFMEKCGYSGRRLPGGIKEAYHMVFTKTSEL